MNIQKCYNWIRAKRNDSESVLSRIKRNDEISCINYDTYMHKLRELATPTLNNQGNVIAQYALAVIYYTLGNRSSAKFYARKAERQGLKIAYKLRECKAIIKPKVANHDAILARINICKKIENEISYRIALPLKDGRCPTCDSPLNNNEYFCKNCGQKIIDTAESFK